MHAVFIRCILNGTWSVSKSIYSEFKVPAWELESVNCWEKAKKHVFAGFRGVYPRNGPLGQQGRYRGQENTRQPEMHAVFIRFILNGTWSVLNFIYIICIYFRGLVLGFELLKICKIRSFEACSTQQWLQALYPENGGVLLKWPIFSKVW